VFLSTHVRPELAEDYSDTINNRCRRFITSTMPLCMWKKREREREPATEDRQIILVRQKRVY
jgi:hypothetical protein